MPEARKLERDAKDRLSEAGYRVGFFYFRLKWYPGAIDRFREVLADRPGVSPTGTPSTTIWPNRSIDPIRKPEALPYYERLLREFEQSEFLERAKARRGAQGREYAPESRPFHAQRSLFLRACTPERPPPRFRRQAPAPIAMSPASITGPRTLVPAHVACTDLPVVTRPAPTLLHQGRPQHATVIRAWYKGEVVVLNRLADDGLQVGQQFFARRLLAGHRRALPPRRRRLRRRAHRRAG